MKTRLTMIAGVAMTATLLLFSSSCHHNDDDELQMKEQLHNDNEEYLTAGTDERPSWATPSDIYNIFEYTMSVQVTLQDILLPYASDEDLMCATIGDEIRAVTVLQRTGGEVYFPLVIAGTSGSGAVSLSYYCAQLKRIYTVSGWMAFLPGISPTLEGHPYIINFIPVQE